MRSIVLYEDGLGKVRPGVILSPDEVRLISTQVLVAPITSTIRNVATEVPVGPAENLDHGCVINTSVISTVPTRLVGREIGLFPSDREGELLAAILRAMDFPDWLTQS